MISVPASLWIDGVSRRRFLAQMGVLALLPAVSTQACRRPPRREEVLGALVREVMTPGIDRIVASGRELSAATGRLAETPGAAELERTQSAWKRAALAWKRASVFRDGPLVDTGALIRATYWPPRRDGIDEVLQGSHSIDAGYLESLGTDLKGIYALEYLLFDRDGADGALARLSSEQGMRPREWIRACSADVSALGERVAQAFGPGGRTYAAKLSSMGQDGVNRVVSQMIQSVEGYATSRLSLVLWLGGLKRLRPVDVEGGWGRVSTDLAVSLLDGCERLYAGSRTGGLGALVRHTAPKIHERVEGAFRKALESARTLRGPLEDVVGTNRAKVESLMANMKALEIALKSDLASALGVTLDFASGDAD